jgi:SET domain-containing protein
MQAPAVPDADMTTARIHNGQLKTLVYAQQSAIHGTGLFAARSIAKGEYIGTYWGPQARRDGTYVLWLFDPDNPDDAIGRSGRNLLRYLNHAKRSNAAFDGFDLYARVRIRAGAEITINYEAV